MKIDGISHTAISPCRAAFETWAAKAGLDTIRLYGGGYLNDDTDLSWVAWKVAHIWADETRSAEMTDDFKTTGHGHVTPRKDGLKARCGGPTLCSECADEWRRKHGMPVTQSPIVFPGPGTTQPILISARLYEELKDYLAMETDMQAGQLLRRLRESNV